MQKVFLSNSPFYAVVDDEDYERVNKLNWTLSTKGYVVHRVSSHETIYLHNFVLNLLAGSGVDHKNRNKLDNFKSNLRLVTNSVQGQNRGKFKNNTTGYRGVSYSYNKGLYQAYIRVNYKQHHLGYFNIREDAAKAYDKAALKFFGPTAVTNFPVESEGSSH